MKHFEAIFVGGMFVGLLTLGVALVLACGASSAQSPNPAAAECVAHRTTKQLECVDLFGTKPEIDTCRAKVRAEIDCTIADGGAQDGNHD